MPRDPSWYDAQYNARAAIPDAPSILQSWAERSRRTRERPGAVLDLPYTERGRDDPSERLDIFMPETAPAGGAPILFHIHGGYWRSLDKKDQSFVADAFVPAGALVVVPNYALCPAVGIEHIVMQMVAALAWVWRHAAGYRGDARRIVVSGHSAGGHLAAMMLACEWPRVAAELPPDLVRTAVAISGLFELEPLRHAPFLAPDIGLDAAGARRLSPAGMPAPRHGQLLAFVGADESEEFHRQNQLIRQRWGDSVVPVCESEPGCHHLGVIQAMVDPTTRLNQAVRGALGLPDAR